MSLTFEHYEKNLKGKLLYDTEDPKIFYESGKVKAACMKLRAL